MNTYKAVYWSTDPNRMLLGGVSTKGESCRFESKSDAELRLQGVIDVHSKLDKPLRVEGRVEQTTGKIDIFSDGSVRGCRWGKAYFSARKN